MFLSTHRNKSDHACAMLGARTRGYEPCWRADLESRKPWQLRKLGSVRAAREYDRNAITVAGKIFDWIFSYRVRPRSGAGRGGGGLQRAGSFGSVGLRQTSEQSVQMRLPWRSIRPAEM